MSKDSKDIVPVDENNIGNIKQRFLEEEMQESYLDYAMSVIVMRALPDVRDGLKPVHRRIFYAMHELGLRHNVKFRKSALVVGEVLGKYHPHGDQAVYQSMVHMAQDFAMRYPLIDGQGNFGSMDGDDAAAMRYCLVGKTLVATEQGLLPIENIGNDEKEADIQLKILSKDHKINQATKWFNSGEHPTIKITTNRGYTLQGTSNHPVLTWAKGEVNTRPTFQWKLLENIKQGDSLVLDRSDKFWPEQELDLAAFAPKNLNPRTQKKILPHTLNTDLAFILGCLVSEGTLSKNELEFCNSDARWIEEFKTRWQKVFPDCRLHAFTRSPSSYGNKEYYTLEIHSRYIIEFLKNLGLHTAKSAERTIPHSILRSPKSVVATFLKAYFEGDGSISFSSRMTELSACSKSETLISELQILLLRFGIVSTKRFDKFRDIHKIYIRDLENYRLYKTQIGFISERKQAKLEQACMRLQKNFSISDFVPHITEYARSIAGTEVRNTRYLNRYNFNRYPALEKNFSNVVTAVRPESRNEVSILFSELLEQKYIFEPVTTIEDGGVQKVFSIRVNSECHSFVANGFINHNTEARMSSQTEELLTDLDKETVDWRDNYDATRKEPVVLPAKLPNLLLNGTLGIAVGMATDIPPHNISEIIDGITMLIENPETTVEDLTTVIKGPDFPTGGIIYDVAAIKNAYATGKGSIVMRGRTEITENKAGNYQIIISEIPYRINKATMLERIADLVRDKKLEGIKDVRDESNKEGVRVVIDLKREALANKILNQLFSYTQLQETFHMNMLALVDGIEPRVLNLKSILEEYIKHRQVMVRKRTEFDLKKAKERAHILEGLKKALDHIDEVINTIRKSSTKEEAHANLIKKFKFTDIQAQAILDMRLQTLAGLERKKIDEELKEKKNLIADLESILGSPKKILGIIKGEVTELRQRFGDERRTQVIKNPVGSFSVEDLIPDDEVIISITKSGYVKRLAPDTYRAQIRGGKGVIGANLKDEDVVDKLFSASTHDEILFFTNKGRVFQTKVYELPEGSRTAKGQALVNFLELGAAEISTAVLTLGKNDPVKYLIMQTKNGVIKKTARDEFTKVRRSGMIAINLRDGDELKWVEDSVGTDEVILTTENGLAIRFSEKDVRPMGRVSAGVTGMRLKKGDQIISMDVISKNADIKNLEVLVVTENGLGKKSKLSEYKVQRRAGGGVKTLKVSPKTGKAVAMHIINGKEENDLVIISKLGQTIRIPLNSISTLGRATQGVRVMKLDAGDAVASVTII